MNSTRGGGEALRRLAAWGLCCSVVVAALWLDTATASQPHPRHPEDGEEPRVAREKTAQAASLESTRERPPNGKVTQDRNHRGTLEAEVVGRRRTLDAPLTPSGERDPSEELYQAESARFPHEAQEDLLKCLVKPSCSARETESQSDAMDMFPCMCDDQCYLYGDCCYDHDSVSLPPPPLRPACMPLTPIAGRHYALHRTVFLVNRCPAGTEPQLLDRCVGEAPPSYLMDIPVFSRTSGIGYSNIFCATCHNDTDIQKFEMSISCIGTVNSTTELENMIYHAGELRWSSPGDASEDTELSCLLDVAFPQSLGRWCQSHLVETCKEDWPIEKHVKRCAAYNYYVQKSSYVYKNGDCAVCNGVPQGEIECLSLFRLNRKPWFPPSPSLMELFEVRGDCENDEVWDVLYRRCEHVSCGFLFTLVDGKCVRSNHTTSRDGQSYLNESCYVVEFRQSLSTVFPNQTIYLNETQRLYHFGEYELNGSWVRVCDEKIRWTTFMHIISSVLIIISLVCLVLHMVIFIALPDRRNIPSKNLFSMTISLFMAEFMFVTFFQLKINPHTCFATGVLMYYFLCVSFLWMNVMSIDIFRTFYSGTTRTNSRTSRTIFVLYSLYAWILPIAGVVVAVVVDELWPYLVFAPHFGTDTCWLNSKWGLVAFFTLPFGLVILVNLILYMVSVFNIYTQMKSGEIASSTIRKKDCSNKYINPYPKENNSVERSSTGKKVSSAPSEKSSSGADSPGCKERLRNKLSRGYQSHKKHRARLVLYCKLGLIMGMTWIFAFISIHTRNTTFQYLFIIFNGLQGTFIFVSFDLKKKVWKELWSKIGCRVRRRQGTLRVQANVGSCSLKTTSDSDSKYRCTSTNVSKTHPSHETAESEV